MQNEKKIAAVVLIHVVTCIRAAKIMCILLNILLVHLLVRILKFITSCLSVNLVIWVALTFGFWLYGQQDVQITSKTVNFSFAKYS